jgi:chemotaxis protein methyltransferase CheR
MITRLREFQFTEKDFNRVAKLVGQHAGISLPFHKEALVYGRLARRLRALGLKSMREYLELLDDETSPEFTFFVNALTTNVTSFFREDHHFQYLANEFLPEMCRGKRDIKLRFWSAGCSKGMEPYSLAIVLYEYMEKFGPIDAKILATDLDSSVVEIAEKGVYPEDALDGMSEDRKKKWFRQGRGEHAGTIRVSPLLQRLITFRKLNLMDQWPMKGQFDMVMCRNVVIYFDRSTQAQLFYRFSDILKPNGLLVLGHSETLGECSGRFRSFGKTMHHKVGQQK